tara:strand:+ start:535 stop:708 length:174 start_codon:yes stop_codon:yes gene_type:complete
MSGISTVGRLNLKSSTSSNNTIDGTTGDWEFLIGENNLYLINNKDNTKYKIDMTQIS